VRARGCGRPKTGVTQTFYGGGLDGSDEAGTKTGEKHIVGEGRDLGKKICGRGRKPANPRKLKGAEGWTPGKALPHVKAGET